MNQALKHGLWCCLTIFQNISHCVPLRFFTFSSYGNIVCCNGPEIYEQWLFIKNIYKFTNLLSQKLIGVFQDSVDAYLPSQKHKSHRNKNMDPKAKERDCNTT